MCEKNKKPLETIELTDEQLEQAAGGCNLHCTDAVVGDKKLLRCDNCLVTWHEYRGDNWYCTVCNDPWHGSGGLMVAPL